MSNMKRSQVTVARPGRSEIIAYEGLRHAPENEQGVVFLFSKMARDLGFVEVDRIQPQFPDCYAVQKTIGGSEKVWIEFEFRSRSFGAHIKQLKKVKRLRGFVVCWEHNWPSCERYAEVIELRQWLGLGRRVWIQSTRPKFQRGLDEILSRNTSGQSWTVPARARPKDIVLMYRAGTIAEARRHGADESLLQSIANVFVVKSHPWPDKRWGWMADVGRVATLRDPLRLSLIRSDLALKTAGFVRASLQGRPDVTPHWHQLYRLMIKLNPTVEPQLRKFAPNVG